MSFEKPPLEKKEKPLKRKTFLQELFGKRKDPKDPKDPSKEGRSFWNETWNPKPGERKEGDDTSGDPMPPGMGPGGF